MTVEKATELFGWQETFSEAVGALASDFPDTFASSSMNENGLAEGAVEFVGAAPAGVENYFADVPVPVALREGAKLSQEQVGAAVEAAHFALWEEVSTGSGHVATEYDTDLGQIVSYVSGAEETVPDAGTDHAARGDRSTCPRPGVESGVQRGSGGGQRHSARWRPALGARNWRGARLHHRMGGSVDQSG